MVESERKFFTNDALTAIAKLLYGDLYWQANLAHDLKIPKRRIAGYYAKE